MACSRWPTRISSRPWVARLDAVLGKPHSQFVDGVTRTSTDYQGFWSRLQQAGEAGQFRRARGDGAELWLQGMYSPILGTDGKPFKVVCYLTDVTAERQAAVLNAAFRGALDQLDANVMVADNDLSIIFVNSGGHTHVRCRPDRSAQGPGRPSMPRTCAARDWTS